jgi:xanthine dehydrogenase molybdopterin-binding subunit B
VVELGMLAMEGTFDIPNYKGIGRVCLTNLPSNGAFRGFGGPQGTFIMQSIMYEIAKTTGISFNRVSNKAVVTCVTSLFVRSPPRFKNCSYLEQPFAYKIR